MLPMVMHVLLDALEFSSLNYEQSIQELLLWWAGLDSNQPTFVVVTDRNHGFVRDLDRVLKVTPPRRSTAELLPKDGRTNDHELRYLRRGFELAPHVGHSPRPLSSTNSDSFLSKVKPISNIDEVFTDAVQLVDVDPEKLGERVLGLNERSQELVLALDGVVEVVDDGLDGHG